MSTLRTLTASFLAAMTGCQARESTPTTVKPGPPAAAPQPAVDTSRVAVFPYDERRDQYIFQVYDEKLGESIPHIVKPASLSAAEIAQVETLLRACIDAYNKPQVATLQKLRKAQPKQVFKADNFIINLPRYKRQLVAVINTKGEKEVWANCFCGAYQTYQPQKIVMVEDGGKCFFNVLLNLQRRKWYHLTVNESG